MSSPAAIRVAWRAPAGIGGEGRDGRRIKWRRGGVSDIEAFFGLDAASLLLVVGAYVLGGAVKGALGFALPMVVMATIPLFAPVDLALALNAVVAPLSNLFQAVRAKSAPQAARRFWPILVGVLFGGAAGAVFVAAIDKNLLLVVIGVFVLGFSAVLSVGVRFAIRDEAERRIGFIAGVLAGGIGVISTVNGPIFVLFFVNRGVERQLMVSALGICFVVSGALMSLAFWSIGFLDGPRLVLALVCMGPTMAAMVLGDRLMRGAAPELFRRLVLAALGVLALNLIWRGLQAM